VNKPTAIRHEFVEYLPEELDEGVLYVSISYATAAHLCACGCGQEIVTPLSPTDWRLIFDGATVSLKPSIGNWSYECQSHYWIERDRIRRARRLTRREIEAGRERDRLAKAGSPQVSDVLPDTSREPEGLLSLLWAKIRRQQR
jgi:Family of unknown function (DUF6527)